MGDKTKAYIAYFVICIAWGTTYLAIRVGVSHYPAFLFAGIRQVVSGLLMLGIGLAWYKRADLTKSTLFHNMLIGFLLITIGNGTVSYAEKVIPSGVAALICTMMPMNAVIINLIASKEEKLSLTIVLGMLLAFGGVVLIFKDNIADLANPAYLFGMVSIYFATAFWALGSILNRKKVDIINPIFNSGVQIGFGGLFLVLLSPLVDSYTDFQPFQKDALLSMGYLVVVGSIIAYTAYMYALKKLPVGFVTSYAYINPLVAVLLGYLILDEKLTWYTWLAFVSIVSGVYLVNRGYKAQRLKNNATN
ncbi:MAG: EamA family transporter [Flavipsychrobacter sp.]